MPLCGQCRFYDGRKCRRFPQAVEKVPDDWCGEFKPLAEQPQCLPNPLNIPCRFLGPATGEMKPCPSCTGETSLTVFRCQHESHAANPNVTRKLDCRMCPFYAGQKP